MSFKGGRSSHSIGVVLYLGSAYTVTIQSEVQVCPGLHSCPWTSLAHSMSSVYGPDQHTDRLHRVEAAAIVGPEDPVLEFAAVDASGVPDTIKIGLATSVVPPASFMEMGTVTCYGEKTQGMSSSLFFQRENDSKKHIWSWFQETSTY